MITLFHIGPKGFNIGNHAIGVGMRLLIDEVFGHLVNIISLPATSRYETHGRAGLTSATIHELNQFADGVIVGGGNLYENGELDVNLDALSALQVPTMLFSLSRGRIYGRRGELVTRTDVMPDRVVRGLNEAASWSLARDLATHDYLLGLGVENARLGGCPTLLLDRVRDKLPVLAEADRDLTLLSVRNPSLMNVPGAIQARTARQVLSLTEALKERGHRVRLLAHDHRDIPFVSSLGEPEWTYTDDVMTYLAIVEASRVNVTYRLHSALPALAFGRPFVKLSYDERSLSLMDTVGLGDWNVDITDHDELVTVVLERLDRLDDLDQMVDASASVRERLVATMRSTFVEFAAAVREHTAL